MFTVRQPISPDPNLRREGLVISTHKTAATAFRAIGRELAALQRQPGQANAYLQRYVWDDEAGEEVTTGGRGGARPGAGRPRSQRPSKVAITSKVDPATPARIRQLADAWGCQLGEVIDRLALEATP